MPVDDVFAAGDRPPTTYERAPEHAGIVRELDVVVPMRDGVKLVLDVYRPRCAGAFSRAVRLRRSSETHSGAGFRGGDAAATILVDTLDRAHGGRRHPVLRGARLCPCHRLAPRHRPIGRRRLARMGRRRSGRQDHESVKLDATFAQSND